MKGAGDHVQYSVFRCDLTDQAKEELIADLLLVIHATEDQVLFIDLGPATGRAATCVTSLGLPYDPPKRGPSSSNLAPPRARSLTTYPGPCPAPSPAGQVSRKRSRERCRAAQKPGIARRWNPRVSHGFAVNLDARSPPPYPSRPPLENRCVSL